MVWIQYYACVITQILLESICLGIIHRTMLYTKRKYSLVLLCKCCMNADAEEQILFDIFVEDQA